MKNRICLLILAASLMISVFAGCSNSVTGDDTNTNDSTTGSVDTSGADTEFAYNYGQFDYKQNEIRFMQLDEIWDMYIALDAEEDSGNKIDYEVYKRNSQIESMYNCVIKVDKQPWLDSSSEYANKAALILASGDDMYDVMYFPINCQPNIITNGYLYDLKSIDSLQTEKEWWDRKINDTLELNGNLYFASSALMLQSYDSAWGMFYNRNIMRDHNITDIYDYVVNDQWNFDTMLQICKQVANINTSESFVWKVEGDQVYGVSMHEALPDKLVFAAGESYAKKSKEGIPEFTADTRRFIDVVTKIEEFFSFDGNLKASCVDWDATDRNAGYVYAFASERALFLGAEIKTGRVLKKTDYAIEYGIAPLPKYNENQDTYYAPIVQDLLVFTMPVTVKNPDEVGVIIDAMTYLGAESVLPEFYRQTLYRSFDVDEDVEMLQIIGEARGIDLSYYYGWNNMYESIRKALWNGKGGYASIIDANKDAFVIHMNEWLETLSSLK